ncbi:hypothetical protein CDIK_0624 [Cucumispora dikerogammari]|nr:hypothetical protein CDIK_0624 [Cucumispora dikerogammari]
MNVMDTIHELRELMFKEENIPLMLNQINSSSLIIENIKLPLDYEVTLRVLYFMYVESPKHGSKITEIILKRNPCTCFLNELMNSVFFVHKILVVDLIKNGATSVQPYNSNRICFKSNKCTTNVDNLTDKTALEIYKKLLGCNKFRVVRHTLIHFKIKLNMDCFESYSYIENLYKEDLVFPYKLYFFLNFETEKDDKQIFNIKTIFDTFYLINNWKIKLLLAKEISKIYEWDAGRAVTTLIYLQNIIIDEQKNGHISQDENMNFGEELAYKVIEGLKNFKQTDLALSCIFKLFDLFDERFQETCLETLKVLDLNFDKQEKILIDFINQINNSSLFIRFSMLTIFGKQSSVQEEMLYKCIKQIPKSNCLINEMGTKIPREFSTEYRTLKYKNFFVKNWKSRQNLIKCFQEIITSQNGLVLFNTSLKESYLTLFNDSVAAIRVSVFESYVDLVCKWGCEFIENCYLQLTKIHRKESKRAIGFSLIYGELTLQTSLLKASKKKYNNVYILKAIKNIEERNNINRQNVEILVEKISDIVDSNALKWFGY